MHQIICSRRVALALLFALLAHAPARPAHAQYGGGYPGTYSVAYSGGQWQSTSGSSSGGGSYA